MLRQVEDLASLNFDVLDQALVREADVEALQDRSCEAEMFLQELVLASDVNMASSSLLGGFVQPTPIETWQSR